MREIMTLIHKGSHWGLQVRCDVVLRTYGHFLSPCKMLYGFSNLGN
jgi:hypothetical protein